MDPNITAQNFTNLSYQPLFIIQNKQSPILLQKMYSVARPTIINEETIESNTLKKFYENSLNVVGHINPAIVQESDLILTSNQSPNVEEYLINPVKSTESIIKTINIENTINRVPVKRKGDVPNNPPIKGKKKLLPQRTNNITENKHTSVHLLKVGNKYHSIGNLSEEQMKLVKQALENIGDPEMEALKPTYDAATNTKITYKVVSPNDLKLVGQNNIIISKGSIDNTKNGNAYDTKMGNIYNTKTGIVNVTKKASIENTKKGNIDDNKNADDYLDFEKKGEKEEPIITRSGRKVKVPKHIQVENEEAKVPHKQKTKRSFAQCFNCSNGFTSVYRLQQHYDRHPSHIPSNSHRSLYDCLLSIINTTNTEDQAGVFLRQLEDFITKLKSSLPCMLRKLDGAEAKSSVISEHVGRFLGVDPGNYSLNIDGLSCINNGSCKHSAPKPPTFNSDASKPSHIWLSKHIEETAIENEEICARTNSIDKWYPYIKRVWNNKKSLLDKSKINPNKETEIIQISDDMNTPITIQIANVAQDHESLESLSLTKAISTECIDSPAANQPQQASSSNFDLCSPPIQNQSSEVFTPFQINLSKIAKYDGQLLRPELFAESAQQSKPDNSLDGILQHLTSKTSIEGNSFDIIGDINCKNVSEERCFERSKTWAMENIQSQDSYQTNACIQPTMLHMRDAGTVEPVIKHTNDIDRVLNLSDSLIPEPLNDCLNFSGLRHNSIEDLPLDLFNFNNP